MQPLLVCIAIEPRSEADQEKLGVALQHIAAADPTIRVEIDPESGQSVIAGASTLQLDILIGRLRREFKVEANIGEPQVAYRETLGQPTEVDYTHKKQTGDSGQFARVKIQFEPLEAGEGEHFESKIVGGSVPREYIPGVEKGLKSVAETGILAGFPVIDYKTTLVDGAYHDVDSSVLAFEIAARAAFREAAKTAKPMLLEPVMTVEVATPQESVGRVVRDFNARRGEVLGQEAQRDTTIVTARVPLANLFDFHQTLPAIAGDQATYVAKFERYAPVPHGPPDDDPFPPAVGVRV